MLQLYRPTGNYETNINQKNIISKSYIFKTLHHLKNLDNVISVLPVS